MLHYFFNLEEINACSNSEMRSMIAYFYTAILYYIYTHNKENMNTNYFDVVYDKCMKMRSSSP